MSDNRLPRWIESIDCELRARMSLNTDLCDDIAYGEVTVPPISLEEASGHQSGLYGSNSAYGILQLLYPCNEPDASARKVKSCGGCI